MTDYTSFPALLETANNALATLNQTIGKLNSLHDAATAEIDKYLRLDGDVELDPDAIRATVTRPYTLVPINEQEAWLIHWRGVKMPIFGWFVSQEAAFIKSKVSRSMDFLTPLPAWMKEELGWKPAEHKAVIDGTRTAIRVTEGDEATFRKRYGENLGKRQEDGSFKIKGGDAWIKLVASLISDGILPYNPTPVNKAHWNSKAVSSPALREIGFEDYQQTCIDEFLAKGAVLFNLPPSAKKTFTTLHILTHFIGRVLILGDSSILVEQWEGRLKTYTPHANATVSTYQGASKYLDEDWDLIVFDECQRLPANTFSRLAFAKTKYRIGLSGTTWREDNRQFMIVALCGFPVAVRWAELIRRGLIRKPRIIVATGPTEASKVVYVKSLLTKRRGRAIIFCDWIEQGQALADELDVPFINGSTKNKLQKVQDSEVCVISRIGDRGLSLPNLQLVVEVAGQGKAREQFGQRVGRLFHGDKSFTGQFHTVFTDDEARKYRSRIYGVEAELAGEVDIEFVTIGANAVSLPSTSRRSSIAIPRRDSTHYKPTKPKSDPAPKPARPTEPEDEIDTLMRVPTIANKLERVYSQVNSNTAPFVKRLFRLCYGATFSAQDIVDAFGLKAGKTIFFIRAAAREMKAIGLILEPKKDHFTMNKDELNRLQNLARVVRK